MKDMPRPEDWPAVSCHPSSRSFLDVALRTQVELQPSKLAVAGSNRKAARA
jgi:hypothetical protein